MSLKNIFSRKKNAEHDSTPPEVKALRERMTELTGDKTAVFDFNLTRSCDRVFAVGGVTKDSVILLTNGENPVYIPLSDVENVRFVNYIGCAAIEYEKDGDPHELCRGRMDCSRSMQHAVKLIKLYRDNVQMEDEEKIRCEKCGRQFPRGSQICPHCVDKRRLYGRLLPYAKPYTGYLVGIVLTLLLSTGVSMLLPQINSYMVDNFLAKAVPSESTTAVYLLLVLAMAVCGLVTAVGSSLRGIFSSRMGNRILVDLRRDLYGKIHQLSLGSVMRKSAGELINRITSDTNTLREFLTSLLPQLIQQSVMIVCIGTLMLVKNFSLSLLVLVPVPFIAMLFTTLRRRMHKLYHLQWHIEEAAGSLLQDVFSGIRVVKVFGTEAHEEARFNRAAKRVADIAKRNELTWNLLMPFANFLFSFGEYAVLIIVGKSILDAVEGYSLGTLIEFVSYIALIYDPIRWMVNMPRQISRTNIALTKLFDIMDEKVELTDGENAVTEIKHGNIEFRHVAFSYNTIDDVLKDVSFTVGRGEMLGIVGRSGAGKSTAINLMMRLFDVSGGEILIDGINIKEYSQHALRSQIGAVLQDTFLFKGTIYSNIAYTKPDATYDEVIRAAKLANAHEFIMKQPDGYNTYVGEGGYTLSGGERQRIAIARAVLKDPKILILDEATASLDTETERQIQDALARLIEGRTTVAIAHRLSTLRNATKLVVFEKGVVEESGTHDELMQKGGRYSKLVMAQREMSRMAGEISAE